MIPCLWNIIRRVMSPPELLFWKLMVFGWDWIQQLKQTNEQQLDYKDDHSNYTFSVSGLGQWEKSSLIRKLESNVESTRASSTDYWLFIDQELWGRDKGRSEGDESSAPASYSTIREKTEGTRTSLLGLKKTHIWISIGIVLENPFIVWFVPF